MAEISDKIRSVQKRFLEVFQQTRDSDEALQAAGVSRKVMESWISSDITFLRTLSLVSRYPDATFSGTDYERYISAPAEGPVRPSVLIHKDANKFFLELDKGPITPQPSPGLQVRQTGYDPLKQVVLLQPKEVSLYPPDERIFSNPAKLYRLIDGDTLKQRHMRQAVFLYIHEREGEKKVTKTSTLLGINKSLPYQWAHENYPAFTPEFKEAILLGESTQSGGDWQVIPAYAHAMQETRDLYVKDIKSRASSAKRGTYETWQNIYNNKNSTQLERQAVFLLSLEKSGGDISKAASLFGQLTTNAKRWRQDNEYFAASVREIVDAKGASTNWKEQEPYSLVLAELREKQALRISIVKGSTEPLHDFFESPRAKIYDPKLLALPVSAEPFPEVFSDPRRLYHLIEGNSLPDRHMRQAVFLYALENLADGKKKAASRFLDVNGSIAWQWSLEQYPAYTPEFKQALEVQSMPGDKGRWRSLPVYDEAIKSIEETYTNVVATQAHRDVAGRSEQELWQDKFSDHKSDTVYRQTIFLLALEKAEGNLNAAGRLLGKSVSTAEKWRQNDPKFHSASQEIIDSKGQSGEWKNRRGYASAIRDLKRNIKSPGVDENSDKSWVDTISTAKAEQNHDNGLG